MLKPVVAALLVGGVVSVVGGVRLQPDRAARGQDWPFYGGDQGGMKYSPLTDVNASTVSRLGVAWEWSPRETARPLVADYKIPRSVEIRTDRCRSAARATY